MLVQYAAQFPGLNGIFPRAYIVEWIGLSTNISFFWLEFAYFGMILALLLQHYALGWKKSYVEDEQMGVKLLAYRPTDPVRASAMSPCRAARFSNT